MRRWFGHHNLWCCVKCVTSNMKKRRNHRSFYQVELPVEDLVVIPGCWSPTYCYLWEIWSQSRILISYCYHWEIFFQSRLLILYCYLWEIWPQSRPLHDFVLLSKRDLVPVQVADLVLLHVRDLAPVQVSDLSCPATFERSGLSLSCWCSATYKRACPSPGCWLCTAIWERFVPNLDYWMIL